MIGVGYRIPYSELDKEILELKYSDLIYDKQTENVWLYVNPLEGMVIWVLPKGR